MDNIFTIDFETTGLDPKTAHPIEVALYSPKQSFDMFIKPPINIPPETSAVHHITDDDVQFAEPWSDVKSVLAAWAAGQPGAPLAIFVAHNADYEKAILAQPVEGQEPFPPVLWICTYKCALRIWPDAPGHKNEVLRYWLGLGNDRGRNFDQQSHSALHDAKVTYALLHALLEHATIEQLIEWTELPAKLPKMPMGKHFGQTWDTVPAPYLQWCIAQADMREDVKFCAKEELDRRKKENATKRFS